MLAVIVSGGKQYKVQKEQVIEVERLNIEEGSSFAFDKVLLLQDDKNIVTGADAEKVIVDATVVAHTRGTKINVVKFKRRKRYLRQKGHKQLYTKVKIESIGVKASKKAAPKKAKGKTEE